MTPSLQRAKQLGASEWCHSSQGLLAVRTEPHCHVFTARQPPLCCASSWATAAPHPQRSCEPTRLCSPQVMKSMRGRSDQVAHGDRQIRQCPSIGPSLLIECHHTAGRMMRMAKTHHLRRGVGHSRHARLPCHVTNDNDLTTQCFCISIDNENLQLMERECLGACLQAWT